MTTRITTVADLDDGTIDRLLWRARAFAEGRSRPSAGEVVGLAFFETSLRTRVGFAAAAARVGASVVEITERRSSERSMPESVEDTIRTVSGYCDALVVRSPHPSDDLARAARAGTAWLNAGDDREHPSQALVDLFAIERLVAPIADARVALCGDLRMRAARSLIALLARRPPAELRLITDESLGGVPMMPPSLAGVAHPAGPLELAGIDVLYAVGIPHGAATEPVRTRLRIDRATLEALPETAILLSPLPLIDEVASAARRDPRVRWFKQSDLALFVRMALVEHLLTA